MSRYHKNFHKSRLDNTVYLTNQQISQYGMKGQVVDLEKYHAERIRRMHEKSEAYLASKQAFIKAEQGVSYEKVAAEHGGQGSPQADKAVEDLMHHRIDSRIDRNLDTISMVPAHGAGRSINKGKKFNTLIAQEKSNADKNRDIENAKFRKFNVVHQSEYRFNQDLPIKDSSFASNPNSANKRLINVQREDAMLIPHDPRKKKNINTLNNFVSGASCAVSIDRSLLPPQIAAQQIRMNNRMADEPQFYRKV